MPDIAWSSPDPSLELFYVSMHDDIYDLFVRSTRTSSHCPACSALSSRPHSRYSRIIQDLPISGRAVELRISTRKWFCDQGDCPVRIFTERFDGISMNRRRTDRTEQALRKIAFSTSCLTAEKVAHSLQIPVSHDALLELVHRTEITPTVSPFLGA